MATVIGNGEGVLPNEGIFHCSYKLPWGLLLILLCADQANILLSFDSIEIHVKYIWKYIPLTYKESQLRHTSKVTGFRKQVPKIYNWSAIGAPDGAQHRKCNELRSIGYKVQIEELNCILCKFHFALFYSVFWKQTLEILERAATAASVCLEPLLATTLARSQDCSNSSYKPFQLSRRRQTWRQSSKVWTSKEDKSFWLKKSILTRNMTWKPLILIHNPLTFGITIINPWEMLSSHLFCQHYYKVWVPWVPSSCSFLWILLNFFWAKACTFRGSCRSLTRS